MATTAIPVDRIFILRGREIIVVHLAGGATSPEVGAIGRNWDLWIGPDLAAPTTVYGIGGHEGLDVWLRLRDGSPIGLDELAAVIEANPDAPLCVTEAGS